MKASRNPSPLGELNFETGMTVSTLYPPGHAAVQRMHEELAVVLRQRTEPPESWVQLYLGFLCQEAPGKAGWQVGRQPGTWAWLRLAEAQGFMGELDDGQGQPVIVSTWCPTWPELDRDVRGYFLGAPRMALLANTCWWVESYALYKKPAFYKAARGASRTARKRTTDLAIHSAQRSALGVHAEGRA